ncbi:PepSY domain-containing protein [Nocardiopsis sp. EMB25]|uniref:PepSY-associated TM helix domain-containing protein n=1 Tax=Nocardiopsis sp. EMB25 TaxID=2835867 RepID=UPI00228486D3|nr:PepSY-associated TM helix domain-containing protein [Nocardiopsis sp. EMB25]MCY9787446.1 PepSY domain-containing protein [Nocardiopsis sp. EMB25]
MEQAEGTPPEDAAERTRRGAWTALRPLVLRLHFYAGVFVAPFVLIAAVTGLLYVWTPQIEDAAYADLLRVEPAGETLPLHEQVRVAREELPDAELDAVRPPTTEEDATRVLFDVPGLGSGQRAAVFVDPYDGDVLGVTESYGTSGALPVRTWIEVFHRNLHLGDVGRLYSELAASWLWVVALGGVALWIARVRRSRGGARRALVPGSGTSRGRARSVSLHGATGLWITVGLLFLSATGMTWSQYAGGNIADLRERMSWTTPSVSAEAPPASPGVDLGVDAVSASARDAGLDGPIEIAYPETPASPYVVRQLDRLWPTRADSAAIAPDTAEVTDVVRFADYPLMAKFTRWGIDAHMGLLFGVANQVVLTVLTAGLLAVVGWGYRMWWQRRPTRSRALGVGRPYPRGAFRALPLPLKAVTVVVLAAVGWAVPLVGVSLLVFLAVDAVLGWRARRNGPAGADAADAAVGADAKERTRERDETLTGTSYTP